MSTKDEILKTARNLYNAKGTDTITVRHIAAEMGISHGNLCYHFPNTQSIVRQLYLDLVARLDALVAEAAQKNPAELGIKDLVDSARSAFENFYAYRFIMLDFARVMRNDHWIRDHYRQLVAGRREAFRMFFMLMQQGGLIRPERVKHEYEMTIELILVCGDFWMTRAEIMRRMPRESMISHYLRVLLAPFPGMLTEKGLQQWNAVFDDAAVPVLKEKTKK